MVIGLKKTSVFQIILYFLIVLSLVFSVYQLFFPLNSVSKILIRSQLLNSSILPTNQSNDFFSPVSASVLVPAVEPNGSGVMVLIQVSRVKGNGGIIINDLNGSPQLGFSTRQSIYNASVAARSLSGVTNFDLLFTFNSSNFYLDGPSAGAAMAVASWSALTGIPLRTDTTLTGAIDSNGTVVPVGDLLSKAKAAKQNGFSAFLVPNSQTEVAVPISNCQITNCTSSWSYQLLSSITSITIIPYSNLQQAVMQMSLS